MKRVACAYSSSTIKDVLIGQLAKLGVPEGAVDVTADAIRITMKDTDPQTLRIIYRPLLDPISYIDDRVKLEVRARSLNEAAVERPIRSFLDDYMPNFNWSGKQFHVSTVEAKRTFIEKAFYYLRWIQIISQ